MTIVDEANTETYQIQNNAAYKARSNKDRWSDSVRISELFDYDPTGDAPNGHTVFQTAFNEAVARGRSEVIAPAKFLRCGGSALITNPPPSSGLPKAVHIRGQGADVSTLMLNVADENLLNVGQASGAKSNSITFEGIGFVPNAPSTLGAALNMRNITGTKFINCDFGGFPNLVNAGLGASAPNDVENTYFINCNFDGHIGGRAALHLGSVGILHILGGKANGVVDRPNDEDGGPFILHEDPTHNGDGVYIIGMVGEGFSHYIRSIGKGLVNVEASGGQFDRADIAFQAQASAGGSDRNWNIKTQILEGPYNSGARIGVLLGGGGGQSEGHTVAGCSFQGLSQYAVRVLTGSANVNGNTAISCGHGVGAPSRTTLFRWGPNTVGVCGNNFGKRAPSDARPAFLYGTEFEGPVIGDRSNAGNIFKNMQHQPNIGTP